MIAFIDLQFVTRRRRREQMRRAVRLFCLSTIAAFVWGSATIAFAVNGQRCLAIAAFVLLLCAFALNCLGLSRLREITHEEITAERWMAKSREEAQ